MADKTQETKSEGIRRVQFDLHQDSYDALEEMRKLAGVSTKALVVRNALFIYRYFLESQRDGKTLALISGQGDDQKVETLSFKF